MKFDEIYYIRMISGGIDSWTNGLIDKSVSKILKDHFSERSSSGNSLKEISVFGGFSWVEEVQSIAALYTTKKKTSVESQYSVRILTKDLLDLQFVVKPTNGGTGVPSVDSRHFDLIASEESYLILIKRIISAIQKGENRLRKIEKYTMSYQLNTFLTEEFSEIEPFARKNCRATLKLPDETKVRSIAHQKWQDRGCPLNKNYEHWFEAENHLLSEINQPQR